MYQYIPMCFSFLRIITTVIGNSGVEPMYYYYYHS